VKTARTNADSLAKSIYARLDTIRKSLPGSRFEGEANQIKGLDSLRRKVATKLGKSPGASVESVIADVKDMVRYTFVFRDEDYTAMAIQTIKQLKEDGFRLAVDENDFKNFWQLNEKAKEYKGINIGMYDPVTKLKFELQLHTRTSVLAKEAEHTWYNWKRIPGVTEFEEKAAEAQTNEIFGVVEFPDGAVNVKW
jgi:hypothetical protein